jgi:hypothetical protein
MSGMQICAHGRLANGANGSIRTGKQQKPEQGNDSEIAIQNLKDNGDENKNQHDQKQMENREKRENLGSEGTSDHDRVFLEQGS